jgi:hypothetical protein
VNGGGDQKIGSFSLIERVILSAGAMLIFSVSFQIDQMPEGRENRLFKYIYPILNCVPVWPLIRWFSERHSGDTSSKYPRYNPTI